MDTQFVRYIRQLLVPEMDEHKQAQLTKSSVAVIGLGGLGCHIAPALAAAGVGTLHLLDDDYVNEHNLPRQWIYAETDIGNLKVLRCRDFIVRHQSEACVIPHAIRVTQQTLNQGIDGLNEVDLVIDASDNVPSRLAVNQFAQKQDIPLIVAAVAGWQGHVASFDFRQQSAPCYQCVIGQTSLPSCLEDGVLGPMVSWVSACAALIALKWLIGLPSASQWIQMDGKTMTQRAFSIQPDPHCQICGEICHD